MTVIVCHGFIDIYLLFKKKLCFLQSFQIFSYCVPAHSVIYYHSRGGRAVCRKDLALQYSAGRILD